MKRPGTSRKAPAVPLRRLAAFLVTAASASALTCPAGALPFGEPTVKARVAWIDEWNRVTSQEASAVPGEGLLAEAVSAAKGLLRDEAAAVIDAAVSASVAYRHLRGNAWKTPSETAATGNGNCMETALLKRAMFEAAGFPASDLRITVVWIEERQQGHAVLSACDGAGCTFLDILAAPAAALAEGYVPLVTLGEDGSWLHGRRR